MRQLHNFIACILAFIATFHVSGTTPPLSLTLHAQRIPAKAGEEIRLGVTVTNTSGHNILLVRAPGTLPDEEMNYQIEIRGAQGQEPPITPFFRELKEKNYGWGSYLSYTLGPGKTTEDSLVLTKLYNLKPGEYEVSVRRALRPMWQILDKDKEKSSVKSNTIKVRVEPAQEKKPEMQGQRKE